jgi:hypothetical protein
MQGKYPGRNQSAGVDDAISPPITAPTSVSEVFFSSFTIFKQNSDALQLDLFVYNVMCEDEDISSLIRRFQAP